MKTVGLLSLRLAKPNDESIGDRLNSFYLKLAKFLYGSECSYSKKETFETFSIDISSVEHTSMHTQERFISHLKNIEDVDIIIIDLLWADQGILRGVIMIHIAKAISAIYGARIGGSKKIIILQQELSPRGDPFYSLLSRYIAEKKVILFDSSGDSVGQPQTYSRSKFVSLLADAQDSATSRLKAKLIRRPGHFKQSSLDGKQICRRYYYDASYCVTEVQELVGAFIQQQYGSNELIIYCDIDSPEWLLSALLTLKQDRRFKIAQVGSTSSNEAIAERSRAPGLLVVPAIYSGHSMKVTLDKVAPWRSAWSNLQILSVLSRQRGEKSVVSLRINERVWRVPYLVHVNQRDYQGDDCPMCKLHVPLDTTAALDEYEMLTAYDIWEILRDANWKREDVRHDGIMLGTMPDFQEIVEGNGAWLASKFNSLLLRIEDIDTNSAGVTVVCPDEKGTEEFTRFLAAVSRVSVIRVPRRILNKFSQSEKTRGQIDAFGVSKPDWYRRASNLGDSEIVILFDELNVSGRTRSELVSFASHFRMDVYCYFSLLDINPLSKGPEGLRSRSLYAFQAVGDFASPAVS